MEISDEAGTLVDDLAQTLVQRGIKAASTQSLTRHVQTVIPGVFVVAQTQFGDSCAQTARKAPMHFKGYFELLFNADEKETKQ